MKLLIVCLLALAIYGFWALSNNEQLIETKDSIVDKLRQTKKYVKDLSIRGGYVCWFAPTTNAPCRKSSCDGGGTRGWHPNSRKIAYKVGLKLCVREYKNCVLEYCEKAK